MNRTALSRADDIAARQVAAMTLGFRKHYRQFDADPVDRPALAMALGWAIRMCRTAEAVVVLHRNGLDPEASPLVRSLMEHAVKLRWLVDKKAEALATIEYGHRRHQRLLRESAERGGWVLDAEGREQPPSDVDMERPSEWATFDQVQQLVNRHGSPAWYATYRLECEVSHATYLSGAVYHDPDRTNQPGFGMVWEPRTRGTSLTITAMWLVMGLGQVAELARVPTSWSSLLDRAAEQLRVGSG